MVIRIKDWKNTNIIISVYIGNNRLMSIEDEVNAIGNILDYIEDRLKAKGKDISDPTLQINLQFQTGCLK